MALDTFFEVKNRVEDVHDYQQVAISVNLTSWTILVTASGHAKATRGRDTRDWAGGWLFPGQRKLTFTSGSLGSIDEPMRDRVVQALRYELDVIIRRVD